MLRAKNIKKWLTNTHKGYIIYMQQKIPIMVFDIVRRQKNMDNRNDKELSCGCCDTCRHKHTPRDDKEIKQLKNRLSRLSGQINGIIKMLDDNRYCGDILSQVAAVESAMLSFGYLILQEHMKTWWTEEIQSGNTEVVDEVLELMKKLK